MATDLLKSLKIRILRWVMFTATLKLGYDLGVSIRDEIYKEVGDVQEAKICRVCFDNIQSKANGNLRIAIFDMTGSTPAVILTRNRVTAKPAVIRTRKFNLAHKDTKYIRRAIEIKEKKNLEK